MNRILAKKHVSQFIQERTTDYIHLIQGDCYNFKITMNQAQSILKPKEVNKQIKDIWVHSIRVRDGIKLKNGTYLTTDEMAILSEAEVEDMIKKVVRKVDFKMSIETTKEDLNYIF